MNRKKHRLLPAIAPMLLALSFLTSGCVEPLDPSLRGSTDPNAVSLPIRLYIPNAMPATKAGAGDVSGVSPESQIYSIQVWMYDHATGTEATDNNQKPVSYVQAYLGWNQQDNLGKWDKSGYYASGRWTSDQIYELLFKIPNSVIESTRPMKFDFYVLANGTSIGSSGSPATPTMTRGELKELKFGYTSTTVDPFGPYVPKTGTTPTNALGTSGPGLPISGFFNKSKNASAQSPSVGSDDGVDLSFLRDKNKPGTDPPIPYTNDEIKAMSPVIQLERAVSKIRFAFARPQGLEGVQICKIEIDAGLIPQQTYVFPRETGNFLGVDTNDYPEDDYTAATKVMVPKNWTEAGSPLLATSAIKEVPDPTLLRSDCPTPTPADGGKDYSGKKPSEMTAQEYSLFLDDNTTSQILYLRESGKLITGKIYYKLTANGPVEEPATFTMTPKDVEDTYTHFYRNHSWIVYAYFQGGALYIKPLVLPWKDGGGYDFTTPGTAYVAISDKTESLFGYGWTTSTENTWYNDIKPVEWYFRRQDQSSAEGVTPVTYYPWSDWVHSQVVVAPGANNANTPIFANRIELHTNGFTEPLRLKLTNTDDFYLVLYHASTTGNAYEVVDSADGALIPADVAANGINYFYVAPKEGPAHLGKTTAAYLITGNSGQKIPFNPGAFPGSNDNSEIYFYSVSQEAFKGYYSTQPENIKAYDKTYNPVEL